MQNEEFVRLWMQAFREKKSREWLCEQTGYRAENLSNKAHYLRKHGVELPKLSHNNPGGVRKTIDYEQLKKIVEEVTHA